MYSLIVNVTVWMLYLFFSFNFVEKSQVNRSKVTICSIPNWAILLQLQKGLRKGDETVTKLTTFASNGFQDKAHPFIAFGTPRLHWPTIDFLKSLNFSGHMCTEILCDLETFQCMFSWKNYLIADVILILADVS